MRVSIDTHALLWYLQGDVNLSNLGIKRRVGIAHRLFTIEAKRL
jgi:PIN domain nuclease of toxin-antitoxin system